MTHSEGAGLVAGKIWFTSVSVRALVTSDITSIGKKQREMNAFSF